MMFRNIDFLAVGDVTTDAFIRIREAAVNCDIDKRNCKISLNFADKVPFESVHVVKAVGNSANAAVAASRLGLGSAFLSDMGKDENGNDCIKELKRNDVNTSLITRHKGFETNYHYVLWYEDERTILVKHQEYPYKLPKFRRPQWIYLSSLASNSYDYHMQLAQYLKDNPEVKLAFQPGTFQMKLGYEKMRVFYERSDVFICNVEEAKRITASVTDDIIGLLKEMYVRGPRMVIITDGPKGAYMFDGREAVFMPVYPDPAPPKERTGCGDAFASTFVSALALGKTPEEALMWAPINPMNVVQYVGAQQGLLTRKQLENFLKQAPADYKPKKIA